MYSSTSAAYQHGISQKSQNIDRGDMNTKVLIKKYCSIGIDGEGSSMWAIRWDYVLVQVTYLQIFGIKNLVVVALKAKTIRLKLDKTKSYNLVILMEMKKIISKFLGNILWWDFIV